MAGLGLKRESYEYEEVVSNDMYSLTGEFASATGDEELKMGTIVYYEPSGAVWERLTADKLTAITTDRDDSLVLGVTKFYNKIEANLQDIAILVKGEIVQDVSNFSDFSTLEQQKTLLYFLLKSGIYLS